MLTVVVLSLLYIGSANMYTTEDFERSIKKMIKNKDRESEVLAEIKSIQRSQASMETELSDKVLLFQSHYNNENVTEEVMTDFFQDIKMLYTEYYQNGTKDRLNVASVLTAGEWSQIVDKYKKEHGNILNARERRFKLLDKEMGKIREAIKESVPDDDNLKKAMALMDNNQAAFNRFYKASNAVNFIDSEILRSQTSTQEELDLVYSNWNDERAILYSTVIKESVGLYKLYSDAQWQEIIDNLRSKFE